MSKPYNSSPEPLSPEEIVRIQATVDWYGRQEAEERRPKVQGIHSW